MKLAFAAILLFALFTRTLARPQYKDLDYKLYEDEGVAVDAIFEVISEKPPEEEEPHHHHHHHKKMAKSNRLDRLKRYLRNL